MIKKPTRIAIALVLALGLIFSSASVTLAKPQPILEIVNLHLAGTELHFQLHLLNSPQAYFYKVTIEKPGWGPITDGDFSPLGKVSKGISGEITRNISSLGNVGRHYDVQVELFNRKQVSLGSTPVATYTCMFTATFHETNNLEGVSIQLYSDPARTLPKGSALTTDISGNATVNLEDGYMYWYRATKTGFATLAGDISVNWAPLTESFTMVPAYTVTFNETNALEGVYIDIYNYQFYFMGELSTNSTGQATIDLPNDTYYYYADISGYDEQEGEFTVSNASLTEDFTMIALYTITFNETNALEGVYIDVYNDDYYFMGELSTNSTGQATIDLLNDTYYYYADISGYDEYEGEFTVSGAPLTEDFTMALAVSYTVTFNETNSLSGIYIDIDNDGYEHVGNVTTDGTGQATIDLPNDTYYYYAYKSGYAVVWDDFTVSSSAQTISFTMNIGYTVTFNETNGVGDVAINVYSDPDRTEGVCSLTTYSSGQGTAFLANGTYYYIAMKDSYPDFLGDFTVSGAPLTVDFTMALQIFAEDFTGVGAGQIPAGWNETAEYPNWGVSTYLSHVGGIAPEMELYWYPDFEGISRLMTPEIDASGYSDIGLTFKHFVDHWSSPYTLKVQVSVDGGTYWADVWSVSPTGNIGPATVTVDLSTYDGQSFKIAWVFDGNSFNIDYWYIDDISVTGY